MDRMLQAELSAIVSKDVLSTAALRHAPHCGQYRCLVATRVEQTVHLVTTLTEGFNEKSKLFGVIVGVFYQCQRAIPYELWRPGYQIGWTCSSAAEIRCQV